MPLTPFATSTQESTPSATTRPFEVTATAQPTFSSRTPSATSEGTSRVVTPIAVDRLAAATLTAAAPGAASPLPAPRLPTTVVGAAPSPTVTSVLRYVFPIQPPEIANYGASHHDYPATDLFAPYRSAYVAVTSGTIDELSRIDNWDPATNDPALRGGRYVSLIGDDGVRYYGSHLDEVAADLDEGMHVAAGRLLGYVGNSGNARGIAPHIHFGMSPPTFAGDWEVRRGTVWPYEYLKAWARGENLRPEIP